MHRTLVTIAAIFVGSAVLAETAPYEVAEVGDGGTIVGRVIFTGTPPVPERLRITTDTEACGTETLSRALLVGTDGGVRDAVINLRDVPRGKPWENVEYTLGQTNCRFEPHVMLFREHADLHILNEDRIAHGVRTYGKDSLFNVGQPKFVLKLLVEDFSQKITESKAVRIGCDLHPWMKGFIVLQKHPYYAVTSDDGTFELTDVPPGEYQLELWHETLGETARRVKVDPQGRVEINFRLGG